MHGADASVDPVGFYWMDLLLLPPPPPGPFWVNEKRWKRLQPDSVIGKFHKTTQTPSKGHETNEWELCYHSSSIILEPGEAAAPGRMAQKPFGVLGNKSHQLHLIVGQQSPLHQGQIQSMFIYSQIYNWSYLKKAPQAAAEPLPFTAWSLPLKQWNSNLKKTETEASHINPTGHFE